MDSVLRQCATWVIVVGIALGVVPANSAPALSLGSIETSDPRLVEALSALNRGSLERAESLARTFLLEQPNSAAGHELLGAALALQRKLNEAEASLKRAIELNPRQSTAYTKLGDIAQARGRQAEAIAYFRQAVEVDPAEHRAHQRLGLYYESQGDAERAIHHFERGIDGTPADYLGVKLNLARLYSLRGRHTEAVDLLYPWAEQLDVRPEVHRIIGGAYFGAGDAPRAVKHLRAAVILVPEDDLALAVLGDALKVQGDMAAAVETYRALVDSGHASVMAYIELATLLRDSGRIDEAASVFIALIDKHPEATAGYFMLGALYGFHRRYEDAAQVYDEGLRRDPVNPALLRGASAVALRLDDAAAALAYAERLLAVAPETGVDAFNRGMIFDRLGAPTEAERAYRAALEVSPENWAAMNNLAVILLGRGEAAEGLQWASNAAQMAGDQPNAVRTLGWAQYANGNFQSAIATLQRALELEPASAVGHYHLGRALDGAGESERGRDYIRRALELDPGFSRAEEARMLLAN